MICIPLVSQSVSGTNCIKAANEALLLMQSNNLKENTTFDIVIGGNHFDTQGAELREV